MKTILVDCGWTFVKDNQVETEMYAFLEQYPNKKILLSNANEEEQIKFGQVHLPYELFSLDHNPEKTNPKYFEKLLKKCNLNSDDVIYFEHIPNAVKAAKSVEITSYLFDPEIRDLVSLKDFIDKNI